MIPIEMLAQRSERWLRNMDPIRTRNIITD